VNSQATPSRDWNAAAYDRVSDVQAGWAGELIERLALRGDEVVLDAGCGSGRVTALLADLVPRGRVYAVDVAPSMVRHTQEALGDRAMVFCQDLVDLELPEQVDALFSNATFHWVPDHDRLFERLHATIKPGGRIVAQCGGTGNIDSFRALADEVAHTEPFAPYFADWKGPWNYQGPEATEERMRKVGFEDVSCWLEPRDVTPEDPRSFVQTVCVVRHLDPLPEELHDRFVDRVLELYEHPFVLHYVRLNLTARRS
jgi:trans-aconitate 2-methyltransferase